MDETSEESARGEFSSFADFVREALEAAGIDENQTLAVKDVKDAITAKVKATQATKGDRSSAVEDDSGKKETKEDVPFSPSKKQNFDDNAKEKALNDFLEALNIDPNEDISGKDLITLTKSLARGELPKPELTLEGEALSDFMKASLYTKITKYPSESFEYVRFHLLMLVSQQGTMWIKSLMPYAHLKTLFLIYLFTSMTKTFLLHTVPLLLFYISIFSMAIYTLQMFYGRRLTKKLNNVESLVNTFDPLGRTALGKELTWKSKAPYVGFLVSCLVAAPAYPMCDKAFIAASFLCIICFFFTVTTLRSYSSSLGELETVNDGLAILFIVLRALSIFQTRIIVPVLTVYKSETMEVTITLGTILEGMTVLCLLLLAIYVSDKGKDAGMSVMLSSVVSIVWFQMGLQLFLAATWRGIFQIATGWFLVLIAFPLMVFYVILQVGYVAFTSYMTFTVSAKVAVSLAVILVTTTILIYQRFQRSGLAIFLLTVLAILTAVLAGIFLLTAGHLAAEQSKLGFSDYCKQCAVDFSEPYEKIAMKIKCTNYVGRRVSWRSYVKSASAELRENSAMNIIQGFPYWMQSFMKCLLGKSDEVEFFQAVLADKCYLSSYNKYSVSVLTGVTCPSVNDGQGLSLELVLQSDSRILKYLKRLSPGTEIVFNATLISGLGTQKLLMDLNSLSFKEKLAEFQEDENLHKVILRAFLEGIKFFIGPVVSTNMK